LEPFAPEGLQAAEAEIVYALRQSDREAAQAVGRQEAVHPEHLHEAGIPGVAVEQDGAGDGALGQQGVPAQVDAQAVHVHGGIPDLAERIPGIPGVGELEPVLPGRQTLDTVSALVVGGGAPDGGIGTLGQERIAQVVGRPRVDEGARDGLAVGQDHPAGNHAMFGLGSASPSAQAALERRDERQGESDRDEGRCRQAPAPARTRAGP
jgi:hypothetical protein